ncbi:hypothetical protein SB861_64710, partial [Paraburkholderia sp. SIMBA_049]
DGGRDTRRLEEELSDLLASTVKIKLGRRGRGQVMIDFGNLDALEGILVRLRGNVATEDVLYLMQGLGIDTGIDLAQVVAAGDFIS